ncbi:hypothetical protein AALA79_01630 [Lachnospiraceae bacterium 64-25]
MNWIIENWFLVVALAAAAGVTIWAVCRFLGLPTDKQVEKIKEWLVWACIEAERELQSGTGQLKLRQVYDAFCAVPAFSAAAKLISFETFSEWVKDALKEAKTMLTKNYNLATYVYGDKADEEVNKIRKQLEAEK